MEVLACFRPCFPIPLVFYSPFIWSQWGDGHGSIGLLQALFFNELYQSAWNYLKSESLCSSGPESGIPSKVAHHETFVRVSSSSCCFWNGLQLCVWETYTKFCCKLCIDMKLHSTWLLSLDAAVSTCEYFGSTSIHCVVSLVFNSSKVFTEFSGSLRHHL